MLGDAPAIALRQHVEAEIPFQELQLIYFPQFRELLKQRAAVCFGIGSLRKQLLDFASSAVRKSHIRGYDCARRTGRGNRPRFEIAPLCKLIEQRGP